MATFRPLTTRGAFVPDTVIAARARSFSPLSLPSPSGFVGGIRVASGTPEPAPPREEREAEPEAAPEPVEAAAPPEPAAAPAPHAREEAAAELDELVQQNQALAAEFAERELVRTAEHAQLLADLDVQKAKVRAATDRLGQLAGELVRLQATLTAELRANAGTLLLVGARKLATESLREQPGLLEGLVRETVDTLACGNITVRVNPDDVERVRAAMGDAVRVFADPNVRAGCIAEGDAGLVDSTVDTAAGSLLAEVHQWKRTA